MPSSSSRSVGTYKIPAGDNSGWMILLLIFCLMIGVRSPKIACLDLVVTTMIDSNTLAAVRVALRKRGGSVLRISNVAKLR